MFGFEIDPTHSRGFTPSQSTKKDNNGFTKIYIDYNENNTNKQIKKMIQTENTMLKSTSDSRTLKHNHLYIFHS